MSVSPHVMSQADAALGRVIAETSTTPSASQYWQQKRPLFRQLAIRVVQAMQEGLGKDQAVARSITELHSEVLQRAATDSARQEYSEWFERRAGFLSGVAKRLWERTTQITASPQESIQPVVRSYKAEMKAHGGWTANQRRYATRDEADAAGRDLYSRWTAAEDYRVVPSSDPPNVEPVINVKPAEETARSDSRIIPQAPVTAPAIPTEPRDIGKPEGGRESGKRGGNAVTATRRKLTPSEALMLLCVHTRRFRDYGYNTVGVCGDSVWSRKDGIAQKLVESLERMGRVRVVRRKGEPFEIFPAESVNREELISEAQKSCHWAQAVEQGGAKFWELSERSTAMASEHSDGE